VAPEEMLDTMELLNLIQTARGERRMEGRSPTSPRQGVGQAGGKSLFNGLMAVGVRDGGYDDGRVWDEDGKEDDGKGGGESYLMHESVSVRFGFCHVFTRVRRDVECGVFDFVLFCFVPVKQRGRITNDFYRVLYVNYRSSLPFPPSKIFLSLPHLSPYLIF